MSVARLPPPNPSTAQKGARSSDPVPIDQLASLALERADVGEIAQRRRRFRDVERFFGLDIHREYLVATAVDPDLRVVYGPTRLTWDKFDAWIERNLTRLDAVVTETPAPTAGAV